MTAFEVDPADLSDGEGQARFDRAAAAFLGSRVDHPASRGFDEAFGALWAYFGHKNEMERRSVIERWVTAPAVEGPVRIAYHLLAWRERATGALAAVRDCFVGVDRAQGRCVVLLSHSYVLPPFRRSGIAALVRTAPATLARQELATQGLDRATPTVLVAEMEPVVPADESSIVRLLSYGRTGFGVVPPAVLPYCQPDFRELAPGQPAEPIPMPCVVRVLDHERERTLATALAEAMVEHLALIHLRACEPTHVRRLADLDRASLLRYGRPEIPLLVLPTAPAELDRLEPLLRSRALLRYPERYRHELPDPDQDLAALRAAAERMERA